MCHMSHIFGKFRERGPRIVQKKTFLANKISVDINRRRRAIISVLNGNSNLVLNKTINLYFYAEMPKEVSRQEYKCDALWEMVPKDEKNQKLLFQWFCYKKVRQLEWDQSLVGRFKLRRDMHVQSWKNWKMNFREKRVQSVVLILLGKSVREHWWTKRMQHSDIKLNRDSNGDSRRSVRVQGGMLYHPRPLPCTHPYSYYLQIVQIAKVSTPKFTLQRDPVTN